MEDLYGDLEDPFFSLEDAAEEEDQPPISYAELNILKEQNTKLTSQNTALKMNISCLFKTAQLELERKESMIGRLMKRIKRLEAESRKRSVSQPSTNQESETNSVKENHVVGINWPKDDSRREVPDDKLRSVIESSHHRVYGDTLQRAVNNHHGNHQSSEVLNQSTESRKILHFVEDKSDKELSTHHQTMQDRNQREALIHGGSRKDTVETQRSFSRSNRTTSSDDGDKCRYSVDSSLRRDEQRSHSPARPPPSSTSRGVLEYRRQQQNKENVRVLRRRRSDKVSGRDLRQELQQISSSNVHRSTRHAHRPTCMSVESGRDRDEYSHSKLSSMPRESLKRREKDLEQIYHQKRRRSHSRSPHRYDHSPHCGELYKRRRASHDACRYQSNRSSSRDRIHCEKYSEHCPLDTNTHLPSPTANHNNPLDDLCSTSTSSKSRSHSVLDSAQDDDEDDDGWSLMSDDSVGCSKFIFDVEENFNETNSPPTTPFSGSDYQRDDDNNSLFHEGTVEDNEPSVKMDQPCLELSHDPLFVSPDQKSTSEEAQEMLKVDDKKSEDFNEEESMDREHSSLSVCETPKETLSTDEESDLEEGELSDTDDDDGPNSVVTTTIEDSKTNIDRVLPPNEEDNIQVPMNVATSVHQRLSICTMNGKSKKAGDMSEQRDRRHQKSRGVDSSKNERHSRCRVSDRCLREHGFNLSDRQLREHQSSASRKHRSHGRYSSSHDQRIRSRTPSEHSNCKRLHRHHSSGDHDREHMVRHVPIKCETHYRTRNGPVGQH